MDQFFLWRLFILIVGVTNYSTRADANVNIVGDLTDPMVFKNARTLEDLKLMEANINHAMEEYFKKHPQDLKKN